MPLTIPPRAAGAPPSDCVEYHRGQRLTTFLASSNGNLTFVAYHPAVRPRMVVACNGDGDDVDRHDASARSQGRSDCVGHVVTTESSTEPVQLGNARPFAPATLAPRSKSGVMTIAEKLTEGDE